MGVRPLIFHLVWLLGIALLSCSSSETEDPAKQNFSGGTNVTFKAAASSTLSFVPTKLTAKMDGATSPGHLSILLEQTTSTNQIFVSLDSMSGAPQIGNKYELTPTYGVSPSGQTILQKTWTNPDVELMTTATDRKFVGKNTLEDTLNLLSSRAIIRFNSFDVASGAFSVDFAFVFTSGKVLAGRISGTAEMAERQCTGTPQKKSGYDMDGQATSCWVSQCPDSACSMAYRLGTNEFEAACKQAGQLIDCGCEKLCSVAVTYQTPAY